jgi:histidine ammonia-lyase
VFAYLGFGLFSDVVIDNSKLRTLQTNLIRSHSAGTGSPLSREETRRLLALRINVLAKVGRKNAPSVIPFASRYLSVAARNSSDTDAFTSLPY